MKIKIHYAKLANQFFFISNLADWHFACQKHYNEKWLGQTGLLSFQEKKVLKKFREIMKRYGFAFKNNKSIYLGIPFIKSSSSQVWKKVKQWINDKEYKEIREIFKILEPRFEKIWSISSKKLRQTKEILRRELEKEKSNKILEIISILYKVKDKTNQVIHIYLFTVPPNVGTGGGANIGANAITFECSEISPKELPHILSVIFHEIAHLFEQKYFIPLLNKYINNISQQEKKKIQKTQVFQEIKNIKIILKEMITSSLLPEGYLSEKISQKINNRKNIRTYYKNNFNSSVSTLPKKYRNLKNLRQYSAYHLYDNVKKYIEQKKPLDENYIKKTYQIFREFEKL